LYWNVHEAPGTLYITDGTLGISNDGFKSVSAGAEEESNAVATTEKK
jgi:hypothetical protein